MALLERQRGLLRQHRGLAGPRPSRCTRARSSPCSASNGAGKTTTAAHDLRADAGRDRDRSSSRARRISGGRRTRSSRLGICHSPEGRRIFPRMTVLGEPRPGRVPAQRQGRHRGDRQRVLDLFPRLDERKGPEGRDDSPAASSRCSRWSRALMGDPQLLLLDEPSMGLAPMHRRPQIFAIIEDDPRTGHHGASSSSRTRHPALTRRRPRLRARNGEPRDEDPPTSSSPSRRVSEPTSAAEPRRASHEQVGSARACRGWG